MSIICQNVKILDLCLRNDLRSPFYEQVHMRSKLLLSTFLPVSKHCQNLFLSKSYYDPENAWSKQNNTSNIKITENIFKE